MKKFKLFLINIFCLLLLPFSVKAASGSLTISGASKAVVGNTISVTVTLSSNTKIGSWQMQLSYDKNVLKLVSSTAESGGTNMADSSSTGGVTKKTYSFKFKALKTGSTKLSTVAYAAYAFSDFSKINLSTNNKTITIITQKQLEASYSKNNDLKSLSVEGFEITPSFSKDTLEYSVIVPEGTKEINIVAKASDSLSTVKGTGTKEVTAGDNEFEIIVRAQNGSEKTYLLKVEVKDENPINVNINNKNFTVVKLKENLPSAPMYEEYTVKINDFDIPAYRGKKTKLVLVGLKDESGKIALYIYDETKKEYQEYQEIGQNKVTIYPMDAPYDLKGYIKDKIKINDELMMAYFQEKNDRFVIIYGQNIETGEKGFYEYDKENQVLMKYNEEFFKPLEEKINLYTYIIIGFLGVFILMFLIIISLLRKKKKVNKKNNDIKEFKVVKKNKETEKVEQDIKKKKKKKEQKDDFWE